MGDPEDPEMALQRGTDSAASVDRHRFIGCRAVSRLSWLAMFVCSLHSQPAQWCRGGGG